MAARGTVPLGIDAYKRSSLPEVECVNLIIEEDKSGLSLDGVVRIIRPGIVNVVATAGAARGLFQQDGTFDSALFGAFGTTLFSRTTGAAAQIGTLTGTEGVKFASVPDLLLVSHGIVASSWNGTAFATIAMPEGQPVVDVEAINGYGIFACSDGTFYWIEPGETTPDPLSFATAESSPDALVGVCRVGDELWFFGRETVEVWQPSGNADLPFQRAPGRQFDRGCRSRDTIRRFDNSVFWVGDDGVVHRGSAVPARVSEFGIEERLRQATDTVSAFVTIILEHKYYVLVIPGQGTFAYDPATQKWSRFLTGTGPLWAVTAATDRFVGIAGRIGRLDASAKKDITFPIVARVTGTLALQGKPDRFDSLTVRVASEEDFTLRVRWKDAQDTDFGPYEDLDARAPRDAVNLYRMGTPDLPVRTYEIEGSARGLTIAGAQLGDGWQ